jgi:hypothetical protein
MLLRPVKKATSGPVSTMAARIVTEALEILGMNAGRRRSSVIRGIFTNP